MYAFLRLGPQALEDVVTSDDVELRTRLRGFETLAAMEAPRVRPAPASASQAQLSDARRRFTCALAARIQHPDRDSSRVAWVLAAVVSELREESKLGNQPAASLLEDEDVRAAARELQKRGYVGP